MFDSSKLPASFVQDLAMKEMDSVAIAIKFADGTCWGWTGESYQHGAQHPAWPLPIGRLRARIQIVANGAEYVEDIGLDTFAPPEDFQTTNIQSGAPAMDLSLTRDVENESPELPDEAPR